MGVFVHGAGGLVPIVAVLQVQPRFGTLGDRTFAVDQQDNELAVMCRIECMAKVLVCLLPATTSEYPGKATFQSCFTQESLECLATLSIQEISIPAAFNIELHFHQRVPSNPPLIQSSPRLYFSSQPASSFLSRRFNVVCPSCFSHTTMLSGVSVSASTRTSEWVVTINWHRSEASRSRSARPGSMSGCRPKFRFLDANEGRRVRVAENDQQAEVAEGSIGQTRRGTATFPSCRKTWTVSVLDVDVEIGYAFVQVPQGLEKPLFDLVVPHQPVQHQSQVLQAPRPESCWGDLASGVNAPVCACQSTTLDTD